MTVTPLARIVSVGIGSIIAFDVLASLASRSFGFSYGLAAPGSWIIYAAVGFAVGRVAPVPYAAAAVALVALAEATIGWWLSWIIGPGRPSAGNPNTAQILIAIVTVVITGGIIGAIAGAFGGRR